MATTALEFTMIGQQGELSSWWKTHTSANTAQEKENKSLLHTESFLKDVKHAAATGPCFSLTTES